MERLDKTLDEKWRMERNVQEGKNVDRRELGKKGSKDRREYLPGLGKTEKAKQKEKNIRQKERVLGVGNWEGGRRRKRNRTVKKVKEDSESEKPELKGILDRGKGPERV